VSPQHDDEPESGLILAAEEYPPESFTRYHKFSSYDDVIIRKLSAHGPVLVRGGRGSGKSALLIEAYRRMREGISVFPVYMSLRYLPLLQSDGQEYIGHFCLILSKAIQKEIDDRQIDYDFGTVEDQASLQFSLTNLAQEINKRIVLLFDDAAHIGREKPLEVFFDLFRTLSSSLISCKASIYPGVTKFGVRFDVFNDSTVIDISRSNVSAASGFFPDVVRARYPKLAERSTFSDRLSPVQFANLLGRAVVGNLRGLILACNRFENEDRIGIPEVTKCFLEMATDHYWPLMEEVAPNPDYAPHAAFLGCPALTLLHAHAVDRSGLDRCSPRSEQPTILLLDANVWISELMLKSFPGASLVDLLSPSAGKILLPEIVERELNQGILRQAQSSGKKATDEIGWLKRLIGQELNFVPPSSAIVEKAIKTGLQALEPLLIRTKFTFEHAVSALDRILSKQLPCGPNNEQFRDACIWHDCISHGTRNKVYFVTGDVAFYESKVLEKGLASALKDELKTAGADVEVFSKIGDLYDRIAPDAPERDTEEIGHKIAQELGSILDKILIDHGFADVKLSNPLH
jgi:hypothetical protein